MDRSFVLAVAEPAQGGVESVLRDRALGTAHAGKHRDRVGLPDRPRPQGRIGEGEQPFLLGDRHLGPTFPLLLGDKFLGNGAEALALAELQQPALLLVSHGIDAGEQELAGGASRAARAAASVTTG